MGRRNRVVDHRPASAPTASAAVQDEMNSDRVDAVTTEVIRNAVISAAEEMNSALIRSAYTPLIYESRDCSVGLFNERAELLGQAAGLPIFLGNLEAAIHATTTKYGLDAYAPGDVYIVNDSYLTGTHLGDISIIAPIFWHGELVGFTATRAHWIDIGAKDRGGTVDSSEIYQEGLRIPPTCLMKRGAFVQDVIDILQINSRFPRPLLGDMHAQIAACKIGENRFREILDRFSLPVVRHAVREIFAQAETLDRAAVARIPDGVYRAQGALDNDGRQGGPVAVNVAVVVNGSDMEIDLTGSNEIVEGCVNCGEAQTISACRVAFKMVTNPGAQVCGGTFRPLSVKVPAGSIFAAQEPAACAFYFSPLGLLIDLVIRALAQAMPNETAAAHHGDSKLLFLRSPAFTMNDNNRGGWGASATKDGENGVINVVSGASRNLPVEIIEAKFPVSVREYGLVPDSGGPGEYRGGLGTVRELQVEREGITLSLWFDRSQTPAWGLNGGGDGAAPKVIVDKHGDQRCMLKVNSLKLAERAVTRAEAGGGGGFGSPLQRDPASVVADVSNGYVSKEGALRDYGVVISATGELSVEATRNERRRRGAAPGEDLGAERGRAGGS